MDIEVQDTERFDLLVASAASHEKILYAYLQDAKSASLVYFEVQPLVLSSEELLTSSNYTS